uniref:Uncharacterized protein n=1 Tax=Panagrolaimus superbus TaxID=310955 RepID=A0A914Z674_9BILA
MAAFTYFTLATLIIGFVSAQQSCTSIDLVANFIVGNETVFQWNATLKVESGKKGVTQVSVEKAASTSKDSSKYHLSKDSNAKASIDGHPMISCSSSKASGKSCSWTTTNSTFNLALPVVINGNSADAQILESVVDENSISLAWGPILQEGNKCNQDGEETNKLPNVQIKVEQCCSTFETVKPPPSSTPTCKKFRSRAIIRESDFSIYATVNTTIIPNMMSLDVTSDYTGPSASSLDISANGYYTMCMTHTDTTSSCSFPLVMGDSKYLFLLQIHGDDKAFTWRYALSGGRLVIRNKEILMEEGVGFTQNNDCFYTSVLFDDGKMGTTELCCKEFA